MFDPLAIKFNEYVKHDQPYLHPQTRAQVDKDFFDRDEVIQRAKNVLMSSARKPVIIKGERRSGKTSVLRLLADHLENDPSGSFKSVEIPWQGISTRDVLLKEIVDNIVFKLDLDADLPDLNQLRDTSYQYSLTTSRNIDILRNLLKPVDNKTVVICIDEFDSIIEDTPEFAEKSRILGLATALVETSDLPIKLLLTLTKTPNIPRTRSSPLISKAEIIPLNSFSKTDLDEMVQALTERQVDWSAQDLQRIYHFSGGWPYFAKLLLVCLANLSPGDDWFDRAISQAIINPGIDDTLGNIYERHFDDAEKAMALLLAKRGGQVSAAEMEVVSQEIRTAAENLVERYFVAKNEDGSYHFQIGFLTRWFPKWYKFKAEVANRLEDILRRLARLQDPWAGSQPVIVTDEDLRQLGL